MERIPFSNLSAVGKTSRAESDGGWKKNGRYHGQNKRKKEEEEKATHRKTKGKKKQKKVLSKNLMAVVIASKNLNTRCALSVSVARFATTSGKTREVFL